MRKKIVLCAALALFAFTLSACNKGEAEVNKTTAQQEITTQAPVPATEAVTVPESTVATTEAPSQENTVASSEAATEATTEEVTTTETAAETTTAQPAASGAKSWDLLNNEPLNPTYSGNAELDNAVANFIANHTDDSMSMFQKVMSVYEYYVHGPVTYVRGMDANAGMYAASDKASTPTEMLWAIDMLNANQGCCYNYAAALMYIMRAFGYDAHLVSGQVGSYSGGTTPHCWVLVTLAGHDYTFDTDLDMNYYYRALNNGNAEPPVTTWFCVPVEAYTSFYIAEDYHINLD